MHRQGGRVCGGEHVAGGGEGRGEADGDGAGALDREHDGCITTSTNAGVTAGTSAGEGVGVAKGRVETYECVPSTRNHKRAGDHFSRRVAVGTALLF